MDIKNNLRGKYILMEDIDFSKISGWGNVDFSGELDGNGYSIKNLTINEAAGINADMHGLFDDIASASTVKNLNLENVNIDSSQDYIGALYGGEPGRRMNGGVIIENCTVSGSIKGGNYTGGLVGHKCGGDTIDCSSSATVTGTGDYTGGLIGNVVNFEDLGGKIENCTVSGSVTGGNYTGGLVGYTKRRIANCSASGSVTGGNYTGGLVGECSRSDVYKSYATGNVTGTTNVGGLVGYAESELFDSYALGNVIGNDYVGGLVGSNWRWINSSYSTGTVTASGSNVGGFVGKNFDEHAAIENCYSTADKVFYGSNDTQWGSTIDNCYGTKAQEGVEAHDKSWFENGENLSFLGSAFNTNVIPPDLKDNPRPVPPPTGDGIQLQVGANTGIDNTLNIETEFSLNGFNADVSTQAAASETLKKVDDLLNQLSSMRANYGATQNRLESVAQSLTTRHANLSSSHSTIADTDFASESANLLRNQILQNVTASLLAQANTSPSIALQLL